MAKTSSSSSKQPSAAGRSSSGSSKNSAPSSQTAASLPHGEQDENYAIVSILYHSLQGAETYSKYIEDAERANDEELVEFFRSCHDEEVARSRRARSLLAERLEGGDDEDEDEDD